MRIAAALGLCALALGGCGGGRHGPTTARPDAAQHVVASRPDLVRTAFVGIPAPAAARMRNLIAGLGTAAGDITRVSWHPGAYHGTLVVGTRTPWHDPDPLARIVAPLLADAAIDGGLPVHWLQLRGDGSTYTPASTVASPQRDRATLAALVTRRARLAGWKLRSLRVYDLGGAVVAATVVLPEMALTRASVDPLRTLLDADGLDPVGARAVLNVLTPAGEPLGMAVTAQSTSGLPSGSTRLVLRIDRFDGRPTERVLDCTGGSGDWPGDAAAACHALDAHRWSYLAPILGEGSGCQVAPDLTLAVHGTYRGLAIDRRYGPCESGSTSAWLKLVGIEER